MDQFGFDEAANLVEKAYLRQTKGKLFNDQKPIYSRLIDFDQNQVNKLLNSQVSKEEKERIIEN